MYLNLQVVSKHCHVLIYASTHTLLSKTVRLVSITLQCSWFFQIGNYRTQVAATVNPMWAVWWMTNVVRAPLDSSTFHVQWDVKVKLLLTLYVTSASKIIVN